MIRTSWKTTISGICGSIGTALMQVDDPAYISLIGNIMLALSLFMLGKTARDRGITSEDEGIK